MRVYQVEKKLHLSFFIAVLVILSSCVAGWANEVQGESEQTVKTTADGFDDESEAGDFQTIAFILFDLNSSEISNESDSILKSVADSLNSDTSGMIEIAGHTDNTGDAEYNQELSQRRAEAVQKSLVEKGISEERIRVVGYGMNRPIAENVTSANRKLNRRVSIWRIGE